MTVTEPPYRSVVRGWFGGILNGFAIVAILFLVCPILLVGVISFSDDPYLRFPPSGYSLRWYRVFLASDPTWLSATRKSFIAATLTALVATTLAVPTALALVRLRTRGRAAFELLLLAPVLVSPMISALALYGWMAPIGLIGSMTALVIGHAVLALPYAVLNTSVSVKALDPRLEQAAMGLGARGQQVFRRVTLPLLAPGIAAAGFFSFLTSFDDVVMSLFLSGREPTLQKRMWDEIRLEISPTVASASTLLVASTLVLFGIAALVRGRPETIR